MFFFNYLLICLEKVPEKFLWKTSDLILFFILSYFFVFCYSLICCCLSGSIKYDTYNYGPV